MTSQSGPPIGTSPGTVPILLLPVRIETRYVPRTGGGMNLRVRVYPDELHIDTHEPALMAAERAAGQAFHATPAADQSARLEAWSQLDAQFGAARAAWIVRATAPGQPDPGERAAPWTRPAFARGLPDRWLVLGYRAGARVITAVGANIPDPLPAGPTPGSTPPAGTTGPRHVDAGMAWMVDFPRAVEIGMALDIPLPTGAESLERLVVVGVRASSSGQVGAQTLSSLLDAHRYTGGLRLLAQGTPTNVTGGGAARTSTAEADLALATGAPLTQPGDGRDGTRLAGALGIAADAFARSPGADAFEGRNAQAANALLWPTTWGHFLNQLVAPEVPFASAEVIRRHFVDWVRARGPLPALRVGRQPYGLLPVLPLDRAIAGEDPAPLGGLAEILRRLRVPFIDAGAAELARPLAAALARTPVSTIDGARAAFIPLDTSGWFKDATRFMGRTREAVRAERDTTLSQQITAASQLLGRTTDLRWTRRGIMVLPRDTTAPLFAAYPVTGPGGLLPRVAADGTPPSVQLSWLTTATRAMLTADATTRPGSDTLLYLLLRSALVHVLATAGAAGAPPSPLPTQLQRGRLDGQAEPASQTGLQEAYAALGLLTPAPQEVLERLLGETLDLASSRWDAWVTSLATRRLGVVRRRAAAGGILLGAYAWVENLVPDPPGQQVPAPFEGTTAPPVRVDPTNAGYLTAPSVPQAVTAAVLRSGQLSHKPADGNGAPLAVNLSSRRVRVAQQLIAGVHEGRQLGELLGYRLERALQEGGAAAYIAPLRELAPLDVPSVVQDGRDAAAAATDVVDGLALARRRHGPEGIPFGTRIRRFTLGPSTPAVQAALDQLDDAIDAVSDALLAEGVHQILQGRQSRAGAALSGPARGEVSPAELEFVRSPASGFGITHRVLLATGGSVAAAWATTPRTAANPDLAAWAASVLGDPERMVAALAVIDPTTGEPFEESRPVLARVSELGLGPLDLVALADRPAELEQYCNVRLLGAGAPPSGVPATAALRLLPANDHHLAADKRALPDVLALARAISTLLASARALDARDIATPGAVDTGIDVGELEQRASTLRARLDDAAAAIRAALADDGAVRDTAALASALLQAWFAGVPGTVPPTRVETDTAALARQAAVALVEIAKRRAPRAPVSANGADADAAGVAAGLLEEMQILLGDRFSPLPRFRLADPTVPERAVDATSVVEPPTGQDPQTWLGRIARVRPAVAAWETLQSCRQLLGAAAQAAAIGQLPVPPDGGQQPWIGLPLGGSAPSAAVSLAFAEGLPAQRADGTLSGLVVDEWSETLPAGRQNAALAFHFDAPGAQAPQAMLLVVPPAPDRASWTVDDLEAAIVHAREVARARLADPATAPSLVALRPFLPAIHLIGKGGSSLTGLADGRLFAPPVGYGVYDLTGKPEITSVSGKLRQGASRALTIAGKNLSGAAYSFPGGGPSITTITNAGDTGASFNIFVPPSVAPGTRTLQAATQLGAATASVVIEPAPRFLTAAPTRFAQAVGHDVIVKVTLTGQGLPVLTSPRVLTKSGGGTPVVATLDPGATGTSATVTLRIEGSPVWESGWDPTDPSGPLKPPKKPLPKKADVGVIIRFGSGTETIDTGNVSPGLVLTTISFPPPP